MPRQSPLMHFLDWFARFWIAGLVVLLCAALLLLAARWVILPLNTPAPTISAAEPADGAGEIAPRSSMRLFFSTPMNPASVEQALTIMPPLPVELSWNATRDLLIISPTRTLDPATSYRITLSTDALGQGFRGLEQPFGTTFTTAPAPRVLAVFPTDGSTRVDADTAVAITFSGLIVPPEQTRMPTTIPALSFDPPITGTAHWLDQRSLLFIPAMPLRPATRYQAVLDGDLADLGGGEIGADIRWSFSTPPPAVLGVAPLPGTRVIEPRVSLALTVSQALDLATVREHLILTPTIDGDLAATTLPDGSQVISFTPTRDWDAGSAYLAELTAGPQPIDGNLALDAGFVWSFDVPPNPELRGRFPGEGQILPTGQDVRLIFSTPMNQELLRAALQLDPPADNLRLIGGAAEVRIAADFAPSTPYTLTIPAALSDTAGLPLGREYVLRFRTAEPEPALSVADINGNWLQQAPDRPVELRFLGTRLSRADLTLYQVDPATLERTLNFRQIDWQSFEPERYRLPLLNSWSMAFSPTTDLQAEITATLTLTDGAALPPGAYYLRARTPEGPRADLVVLVSPVRLLVQAAPAGVLIWATDLQSGLPLPNLALSVIQDSGIRAGGQTDGNGLMLLSARGLDLRRALVTLAESPQGAPGLIGIWPSEALRVAPYRLLALLDQAAYRPGDAVTLTGIVRRAYTSGDARIPAGLQVQYTLRPRQFSAPPLAGTLNLTDSGLISMALPLPLDATPGMYDLILRLDEAEQRLSFMIAPETQSLHVIVSPDPNADDETALAWTIQARTPEGLPPTTTDFNWTLETLPPTSPSMPGFVFNTPRLDPIPQLSGVGQFDSAGNARLVLPRLGNPDQALRHRLHVQVAEATGMAGSGSATQTVQSGHVFIGLSIPVQVAAVEQPCDLLIVALDADARPQNGVRALVEIVRRVRNEQTGEIMDIPVWNRAATTGSGGQVRLSFIPTAPGEYQVRVLPDLSGFGSFAPLYVVEPGFTDWPTPGLLIPEQSIYPPGAEIRLLATTPISSETALLIRNNRSSLSGEVRTIRPDELITTTLQPDDSPGALFGLAYQEPGTGQEIPPLVLLAPITIGELTQTLSLTIDLPPQPILDMQTAQITISVNTADGQPQAADLLLRIAPDDGRPATLLPQPPLPLPLETARWPGIRTARNTGDSTPGRNPATDPTSATATRGILLALSTRADGTLRIPLERLYTPACAAACMLEIFAVDDSGQIAAARIPFPQPAIDLRSYLPEFLRPGDEIELPAEIIGSFAPLTVEVRLEGSGFEQPGAAAYLLTETGRITWPIRILPETSTQIQISAQISGGADLTHSLTIPIAAAYSGPTDMPGGIGMLREIVDPQSGAAINPTNIRKGQLIRIRLTVLLSEGTLPVTIEEALPAGFSLITADPSLHPEHANGRLRWELTNAEPGVYQAGYTLRAVLNGRFNVPATVLWRSNSPLPVAGDALTIRVLP